MSIELLIVLVVVAGGIAVWYFNRSAKSLDLNNDGKVDVADAKVAVENTVAGVEVVAEQAVKSVKKTAKKASTKVKAAGGARSKNTNTKVK